MLPHAAWSQARSGPPAASQPTAQAAPVCSWARTRRRRARARARGEARPAAGLEPPPAAAC
eukprot:2932427-Lingulodinium_polyedra.AAC.1